MKTYFSGADILLPAADTDMTKWSVVACDQFTSQPEYWESTAAFIENAPSTLNFILPECFLESVTPDDIHAIQTKMKTMLSEDFFQLHDNVLIYVERTDNAGKMRAGLVGKIDLEEYDYHADSISKIRPTEATIIERIPPRMKVRQGASLETPHIMLLIDDVMHTIIEPLGQMCDTLQVAYDFPLMNGGGHIKGYFVQGECRDNVLLALHHLCDETLFFEKYNMPDKAPVFFATGDGNHSLATAKACYEHLKRTYPDQDLSNHPARYALVELVNLHSPALEFEPIHRIVTSVDANCLLQDMMNVLGLIPATMDTEQLQQIGIVMNGNVNTFAITRPTSKIAVGSLQHYLDDFLNKYSGEIDYIHGDDVLCDLTKRENCIGFLLPTPQKADLFPSVISDGALPRKTFSMGHAEDKRYYLECRKIVE